MEDSGILTDQLLGAFGPKLKEIVITGEKLHTISWEALEGMYFNNGYRIYVDIMTGETLSSI